MKHQTKEQTKETIKNATWVIVATDKLTTGVVVYGKNTDSGCIREIENTLRAQYDRVSVYVDPSKTPRLMRDQYYVHEYDPDTSPQEVNAYAYLRRLLPKGSQIYVIKTGVFNRADQNFSNSLVRVFVVRDNALVEFTHVARKLYLEKNGALMVQSGAYPESEAARVLSEILYHSGSDITYINPS